MLDKRRSTLVKNWSVLWKEERKAEAAQEEACQELKVILLDKQHFKQTQNYQLEVQLEKKSR